MIPEKFIVIGCDNTVSLSVILNAIKGTTFFTPNIVSASRSSDLMAIAGSLEPDLVILCFRNNQLVLNNFNSFVKNPTVPRLCLTRNSEADELSWNPNCIVFTFPLAQVSKTGYLSSRMNSIFLLKNESVKGSTQSSFAEIAAQQNHPDDIRNLSRYILELDQKVEVLLKIKDRIAELYPRVDDPVRVELTSIVNAIKASSNDQKLWQDFKLYFEQTDPHFLLNLAQKYPQLTTIDLKYCCYLKMNMSNDDICNLLGINQESVRTHKYRLKKKMSLSKNQDLRSYLRSVYE